MKNTDFMEGLSAEHKDFLSHEVEALSRAEAKGTKEEYELVSLQRARISRNILGNLPEETEIILRIYGILGMMINLSLRRIYPHPKMKSRRLSLHLIGLMRTDFNLKSIDDVDLKKLTHAQRTKIRYEIDVPNNAILARSLQHILDETIDQFSDSFAKDGNYFYRIARANRGVFMPTSEQGTPKDTEIVPGDVIMDAGFWSGTTKSSTDIYRYSEAGESATHRYPKKYWEEEILFMIENISKLKAIDISGFKFPKRKEGRTSGEMLIKSETKFRVIGIQKTDPKMDRRVVIVQPMLDSDLLATDRIKNPFNGEHMPPRPPLPGAAAAAAPVP